MSNGHRLGVAGDRAMLEDDVAQIPELRFDIELPVAQPDSIGSRLRFDCSPRGTSLGPPVNGKRVRFAENVFYRLHQGGITEVWPVIDKAATEAQP